MRTRRTLHGYTQCGSDDNMCFHDCYGHNLAQNTRTCHQVFRHNHEVSDGRTSSLSHQQLTLCLDSSGRVTGTDSTNGNRAFLLSKSCPIAGFGESLGSSTAAQRLFGSNNNSSSITAACAGSAVTTTATATSTVTSSTTATATITASSTVNSSSATARTTPLALMDQPGHEKYLKTTLAVMAGCAPDYGLLVVSHAFLEKYRVTVTLKRLSVSTNTQCTQMHRCPSVQKSLQVRCMACTHYQ
jgi:hypothetical protein